MSDDSSVKVAVRVRPFNGRERDRKSKCCLKMIGAQTIITDPESKKTKDFTFDFSYWSHDGYEEKEDGELVATKPTYATQQKVMDDLGQSVLTNAWKGYNCSLFAYGQTGAGKSYSMVGYGVNRGIIPLTCEDIFRKIEANDDPEKSFHVTVSMLEIYNEQVRDLLNIKINPPGGLKVRQKPGVGVYVDKLTPVAVKSYQEVFKAMETGTKNRTVASTQMNATSSRAHTVFTIHFTQITESNGLQGEKTAHINLVDLAGSERAASTGASGDRLKEGANINKSLSALGNVISALADKAMGKKKVFVPYRNSVLTRLLQDALGGNSKTIMIAALSPADINYDETLGTLRYADRAKKIKNAAVVNENPADKMIRELKEENERLRKLLEGKGIDTAAAAASGTAVDDAKVKELEEARKKAEQELEENRKLIEEMRKSWAERESTQGIDQMLSAQSDGSCSADSDEARNNPHFLNLNEDEVMSGVLAYCLKAGETKIGRHGQGNKISLDGLSIRKEHCLATNEEVDGHRIIFLEPRPSAKVYVNGDLIKERTQINPGDRLIFGNNYLFRLVNPQSGQAPSTESPMTYQQAMDEWSKKQGLGFEGVDDRLQKIEEEEARKRDELQRKIEEMQEKIDKEREEAQKQLEQQRKKFESAMQGGGLSAEEREALQAHEREYKEKMQEQDMLESEMAKQKEMTEKIIKSQMKRKRQTKKIEDELSAMMPIVNEANSMAEELVKHVTFEAKLATKTPKTVSLSAMDEMKNLKTIDIQIKVTNSEDGSVWTWTAEKFEQRINLMREMYQAFLEYGAQATNVPLAKDPFWDPPEPVEIGRAYVYLKALSQFVEIENDFAIVDFKGETQGQLRVEIFPTNDDGEDLDYLDSANDIIGHTANFMVRVPEAKQLPTNYANEVFIKYSFFSQEEEIDGVEEKQLNPKFDYEKIIQRTNISEDDKQYLLSEAIVFEVKGFTDAQVKKQELFQAQGGHQVYQDEMMQDEWKGVDEVQAEPETGEPDQVDETHVCWYCEEVPATKFCLDCPMLFCDDCYSSLHKSAKKAKHQTIPYAEWTNILSQNMGKLCDYCEEVPADRWSVEENMRFCADCWNATHKSKKKAAYHNIPFKYTDDQ